MSIDEQVRDLLSAAGDDVVPVVHDPSAVVLRRAARLRRRATAVSAVAAVAILAGATGAVVAIISNGRSSSLKTATTSQSIGSLLARPLHPPAVAAGQPCPATSGSSIETSAFGGVALGDGPVRVLLADRGDLRHGHVALIPTERRLGRGTASHWLAVETLWLSVPGYHGPFVVRGEALTGGDAIEVQPSGDGLHVGKGPLVVPPGPTPNTGGDGYRSVPGSTWVTGAGCYAWQVDGSSFSETIVFDAR